MKNTKNGILWSNLKKYKKLILELTNLLSDDERKVRVLENINDDIEENIHLLEVQIDWLKGEER